MRGSSAGKLLIMWVMPQDSLPLTETRIFSVIVTGTIGSSDGTHDYVSVEGATYGEARTKLDAVIAEDQKLLVIRTDNY